MSKQVLPESTKKPKEAPKKADQSARVARGQARRRQTARVEERRDGKPLIFGYGKQLSRRQKQSIQRRALWTFIVVTVLGILFTAGFAIYNINYRIPGLPIVTVNGHQIPQSLFRKFNYYVTQDLANQLTDVQKQQAAAQVLATSPDQATQLKGEQELSDLEQRQNTLTAQDNIPGVGGTSVEDLVDDELIREQIPVLESQGVAPNLLEATDKDINAKLDAFKKALPRTIPYSQFLSNAKMSDDEFRQILAILVRRDKMDAYQQSLVGPTMPQVHANLILTADLADANKILDKLRTSKDLPSDFANQAKRLSKDPNSKTKGGDLGWVVYGDTATDSAAERWLFDPSRKPGELSDPALKISGGEYAIYYITGIDQHRPVSASQEQSLKSSALTHWISQIKSLPQTSLSDTDSTKLLDANNFPAGLPSGASTSPIPGG
ncbi:MAG TPA: peptidylprolyl isomerase [Ktedonobacterales bacterium]|jgi:hypothetical protein